jgi:hypothetical protein
LFLHYFTYLFKKLQFILIVITRFLKILFRRRRGIELLYLDYSDEYVFENSYIILKYRFRNVLWYRFGCHKTLEKQIKIFNLKNFDKEFDFVVYGFFSKKSYKFKFEPQLGLNAEKFKTQFHNLSNELELKSIPNLIHPVFYCEIDQPVMTLSKSEIIKPTIIIKTNPFNKTNFV